MDFYAPWCIWCQRLEPVFAKLGQELGNKGPIFVGRIDCTKSENEGACRSQHVSVFAALPSAVAVCLGLREIFILGVIFPPCNGSSLKASFVERD